jgi:valyl-tRNA synthetase
MSKSLGNGIDPLEIIEKYGTDALRMSLVLVSPDGQDPNVGRNTFELGRNFSNKLYQASRFVMMRSEGIAIPAFASLKPVDLMLFDRWILSRLARTIEQTSRTTDEFRLFATAKTLYSFVWDDYCSWYLELIKPDQQGESIRAQSLSVANYVLEEILRLLHPFVPFVTEEIFQQLRNDRTASVVRGPWATFRTADIDLELENRLKLIQDLVVAVRSLRSELNVPPSKKSDLHIRAGSPETAKLLEEYSSYFRSLAKVEKLECGMDVKRPALSASAVISGAELFVPLAGLIDVDQERARLNKQLSELKEALEKLSRKLANADFLAKAAADVIDKERGKKADYEERIEKLNKNLEQLVGW